MLLANLLGIVIISLGLVYVIYRAKEQLKKTTMHSHVIVMSISMIVSMSFGFFLGVILGENFILSTIIATSYGVVIGYVIGGMFGTLAILCGVAEGIMGGMMGAMTGNMAFMSSPHIITIILFFNFLFIVLMAISFKIINRFTKEGIQEKTFNDTAFSRLNEG